MCVAWKNIINSILKEKKDFTAVLTLGDVADANKGKRPPQAIMMLSAT